MRKRRLEARESAGQFLRNTKGAELKLGDFQGSYFPDQWRSIKETIEGLRKHFEPDIIFTHHREDRHPDHKTISDLTWNAFRNHLALEYEVPKHDGDLGHPNVFVPIDSDMCKAKTDLILRRHFTSQSSKNWLTEFHSMARIRGIECASAYAEAFYCRKIIF